MFKFDLFKIVPYFIGFVFVIMILYWIFLIIGGIALVNNPEMIGAFIGKIVKGFQSTVR